MRRLQQRSGASRSSCGRCLLQCSVAVVAVGAENRQGFWASGLFHRGRCTGRREASLRRTLVRPSVSPGALVAVPSAWNNAGCLQNLRIGIAWAWQLLFEQHLLYTITATSLLLSALAVMVWRRRLPKRPPGSDKQVVRMLRRVDPTLGAVAAAVTHAWDLMDQQVLSNQGGEGRSGPLVLNLLVASRLWTKQGGGYLLPQGSLPLASDYSHLMDVQRYLRFALAPYGSLMLALTGLLHVGELFRPLKRGCTRSSDIESAAQFLGLPKENILATGEHHVERRRAHRRVGGRHAGPCGVTYHQPWWMLVSEGEDLFLCVRGSASLEDIATDLACTNVAFLHGEAHDGMVAAATNVWQEALPAVQAALQQSSFRRLVVCGHSLGGGVALLLGLRLRAEGQLPLDTFAFAAGPPPVFHGSANRLLEEGLLVVINGLDLVPRLSFTSVSSLVLAARRLEAEGLSWHQKLGILLGSEQEVAGLGVANGAEAADLGAAAPSTTDQRLRIPGSGVWLMEACAGRYVLAVDLNQGRLEEFGFQELPEISNVQAALHHHPASYLAQTRRALKRVNCGNDAADATAAARPCE